MRGRAFLAVVLASGAIAVILVVVRIWSLNGRLAELEERLDRERSPTTAWVTREEAFNALADVEGRLHRLEALEAARTKEAERHGNTRVSDEEPSPETDRPSAASETKLPEMRRELDALRNWLIRAGGFSFVGGSPDSIPLDLLR